MKKILTLFLGLGCSLFIFGQDSAVVKPPPALADTSKPVEPVKKKDWSQLNLSNRSKDHLLIQFGIDKWARIPDSIQTKGLSRSFNIYFMFDFPFKTNPHFSVALGAGISTSNIYFKNTIVDIRGTVANRITFTNVGDTIHFKKFKLLTTILEAPVEFRYTSNPENPNKSWKLAIGGKIGTMLSAGTKAKTLQNKSGTTLSAYTEKIKTKRYFNGSRISLTGRIGYGSLSLFGSYQVNAFIKEGFGPDVRPFSIGITLSGL